MGMTIENLRQACELRESLGATLQGHMSPFKLMSVSFMGKVFLLRPPSTERPTPKTRILVRALPCTVGQSPKQEGLLMFSHSAQKKSVLL